MRRSLTAIFIVAALLPAVAATAQSSSSSSAPSAAAQDRPQAPRVATRQTEAAGSAITLETIEPLFDLAAALNTCGYDAGLKESDPVREQIRQELTAAAQATPAARQAQAALCSYITQHELTDKGRELAQYVSLAVFLGPAPALTPTADETEMPPDALAVVNILPLVRTFAAAVDLHGLWLRHRPQYDAITARVHDPITRMVLDTNLYLKVPVSSYDGRRLLILIEPLLSPNTPNARIYGNDYVVVTSPNQQGNIRYDDVRHLYLHYEIEPLVYARAQSMQRLVPLLKPVQDAPIEFIYKNDVIALVTECLIKAVEARTMDVGFAPPVKPTGTRARADLARYDEELTSYDRRAEVLRRRQVELDMRQGWVLTDYFYGALIQQEHDPQSLAEAMGQIVYGMDVFRVRHQAEQIQFLPQGSGEFVRRVPRQLTGMQMAERKLMEGDLKAAEALADTALADPHADHAEATYVRARVELMHNEPEDSQADFEQVIKSSADPRTVAWAHIYLGRLYDTRDPAEDPKGRAEAIAEYKAALAVPSIPPDAHAAAESGLKTAFAIPRTVHREEEPLDPSGKAEKESYKPNQP